MNITVLIKEGSTARLVDGIRLALGLTINHKISLLITEEGAGSISDALADGAFKKQFLESIGLITSMSGIVRTERAIAGVGPIELLSRDDLAKLVLGSDSIIVF
ncbi:MAG: hypothetical protein M1491_09415 [Deltaproteobacteria bacterium]|nr:hypothetical protein [Deltaproteobacteria bacterium]MCL5276438.1 hypothetical protein [Deltaproteobacteria bacterium]